MRSRVVAQTTALVGAARATTRWRSQVIYDDVLSKTAMPQASWRRKRHHNTPSGLRARKCERASFPCARAANRPSRAWGGPPHGCTRLRSFPTHGSDPPGSAAVIFYRRLRPRTRAARKTNRSQGTGARRETEKETKQVL